MILPGGREWCLEDDSRTVRAVCRVQQYNRNRLLVAGSLNYMGPQRGWLRGRGPFDEGICAVRVILCKENNVWACAREKFYTYPDARTMLYTYIIQWGIFFHHRMVRVCCDGGAGGAGRFDVWSFLNDLG